jgi:hypothetical protein
MLHLEAVQELFRRRLPLAVRGGRLEVADTPIELVDARLVVHLRTIATEEDGTIVDIREQAVVLGELEAQSDERGLAYLEGMLRAAPAIVESLGGIEAILPFELFMYTRVLDDPALVSADDFAAALSDPDRLAAWNAENRAAEWREALEPCGLAEHAEAVAALRRPALRLRLDPIDDEDELEIGSTRFGGDPDLPPTMAWPEVDGEPMVFVAQLDLAELVRFDAAHELPREGLLSFFYSPFPPPDYRLEHSVAVLHLRELAELQRRPAPERARLPLHAIEFDEEALFPAIESSFCYETLLPEPKLLAWFQSLERQHAENPPVDYYALERFRFEHSNFDPDRPIHRLLGHPESIQGDPYLDIEMARRGWDDWREGTLEALARRRQALGWRLLLQIDADHHEDVLNSSQDGGYFYFFMPADALAAHEWSRARGCLQCH